MKKILLLTHYCLTTTMCMCSAYLTLIRAKSKTFQRETSNFWNEKDRVEIYNALMNGAFYACDHISARISDIIFKNNTFTIETGDLNATTIFYKENRTKVKTAFGSTASYTLNGNEKFVRAVVALSNGHNIMTQPIFLINNMQN